MRLENEEVALALMAERARGKCLNCDALKEDIELHRKVQRDAAKATDTWSKKGCDSKKKKIAKCR